MEKRKQIFFEILKKYKIELKFPDEDLPVIFGFYSNNFIEDVKKNVKLNEHVKLIEELIDLDDSVFNNLLEIDLFVDLCTELGENNYMRNLFSEKAWSMYQNAINQWRINNLHGSINKN